MASPPHFHPLPPGYELHPDAPGYMWNPSTQDVRPVPSPQNAPLPPGYVVHPDNAAYMWHPGTQDVRPISTSSVPAQLPGPAAGASYPVHSSSNDGGSSAMMAGASSDVTAFGRRKSPGLAFLLGLFFGPIGMLYSTVGGAVTMFIVNVFLVPLTSGLALLLTIPIGAVWAAGAADSKNRETSW